MLEFLILLVSSSVSLYHTLADTNYCGKQGTVGLAGGQFKATETAKLVPRLRGAVQVPLPAAMTPHIQDADRALCSQFLYMGS